MPDETDSRNEKPSQVTSSKIGKWIKKQPIKRTTGTADKSKASDKEEHNLDRQVKALKKLPQESSNTVGKRVYLRPEDVEPAAAKKTLDFLNAAKTADEIASAVEIPGERDVGLQVARNILEKRAELGEFKDLRQVFEVPQVGAERLTEMVDTLGRVKGPTREQLQELVDKAITSEEFRNRLFADPQGCAAEIGFEFSSEQVETLLPLSEEIIKKTEVINQKNEKLATQLDAMVAENRRLADSIEPVKKDLAKYQKLSVKAQTEIKASLEEKEAASKAHLETEATIQRLQTQLQNLESQLAANITLLKESGHIPFLTADTVAGMISNLTDQIRDNISGLNIKDVEVKLKVAFGGAGDKSGFILPTIESGPEIKDKLHDITIHFERSGSES